MAISAHNVNGFNDETKRKNLLTYIEVIEADIAIIIDTRLSEKNEIRLKNQITNYTLHSARPDTPARGVSVLIRKSLPFIVLNIEKYD